MERSEMNVHGQELKAAFCRLFVAISLPEDVKNEIEKAQRQMREALPVKCVRWTKSEQFHLTLKFLGSVDVSRKTELTGSLQNAAKSFTAIRLHARGIGFFPNVRRPRVVWAGVGDEKENLLRLQQAIEHATSDFTKEEREGKFSGHVTLARIQKTNLPEIDNLAKIAVSMVDRFFGEWVADGVQLIRSELSSTGSRYTTVAAIPFGSKQ